ncbi:MAG: alpha/beta hydrolase domain-containing protein [Acidimicrobiales bacterium]
MRGTAARTTCRRLAATVAVLALAGAACSSSDDEGSPSTTDGPTSSAAPTPPPETDPPEETTTSQVAAVPPTVSGPITTGDGPVRPQPVTPLPDGYTEEEFFFGGTASSFAAVGEQTPDGNWSVSADGEATYETRMLVRRPPADRFSGVVLVEWLNVTAVEASPDWAYLSEEIDRAGHVYVAVSVQQLGVTGGAGLLEVEVDPEAAAEAGSEVDSSGLVNADPDRYGSLVHPGDAYALDIFSQAGAAIAESPDVVLGGLVPISLIGVGESQSAFFLTTYINAVHPVASQYDGFMVHSRGGTAAPLDGNLSGGDDVDADQEVSEGVTIRTDLQEPVFMLQAETDLTLLGFASARQPDTDTVRTWEVAGTAHADAHVIGAATGGGRDASLGSLLGCDTPINTGPHHEVYQAALAHLVEWVHDGTTPPEGPVLELTGDDPVAIARDDLGMALGGIRTPLVDVPVAIVSGDPPDETDLDELDTCSLFGTTEALDQATLVELHGSADAYVAAFRESADAAVAAGFLLPADAEQLIAEAEDNRALFA